MQSLNPVEFLPCLAHWPHLPSWAPSCHRRDQIPFSQLPLQHGAIPLPCPLLCRSITNHFMLAALLTTSSVTQTGAERDGRQRRIHPTAINEVGWGRRGEEPATCTHKIQNFVEDGKVGEVRTKLLEKIFSEDNKHIFAARKEGSPVLPCSHSHESQACCH